MTEWATVKLTQTKCWCGLPFSLPSILYDKCKRDGTKFYCPLGHTVIFRESEASLLRRERDRLQQRLAEKDDDIAAAERSANAYKGQITRLKKRAGAGLCPCCNRSFQNLHRHMKSKHPDFSTEPDLKVVEGGKP